MFFQESQMSTRTAFIKTRQFRNCQSTFLTSQQLSGQEAEFQVAAFLAAAVMKTSSDCQICKALVAHKQTLAQVTRTLKISLQSPCRSLTNLMRADWVLIHTQ
jgi:hypothetical protein